MCVNSYGCSKEGARLSSIVPSDRTRGKGHTRKNTKSHLYTRKHLSYCEGGQTQGQSSQRGCGVSICGGFQNAAGHSPWQAAETDPALSRERSLPAEMIL